MKFKKIVSVILSSALLTPTLISIAPPLTALAESINVTTVKEALGTGKDNGTFLKSLTNGKRFDENLSEKYIRGVELFRVSIIKASRDNTGTINGSTDEIGKLATDNIIQQNPIHLVPSDFKDNIAENGVDLKQLSLPTNTKENVTIPYNTRRDYLAGHGTEILGYGYTLDSAGTPVYSHDTGFRVDRIDPENIFYDLLIGNVVDTTTGYGKPACLTDPSYSIPIGKTLTGTDYFKAISQAIFTDPDTDYNPNRRTAQVMLYHISAYVTGVTKDIYDNDDVKALVSKIQSREYEVLIEPMIVFEVDDNIDGVSNTLEGYFGKIPYIALTCGDLGAIDDAFSTVMPGATSIESAYDEIKTDKKGNVIVNNGDTRGYNAIVHNKGLLEIMAKFHKSLMLTESHSEVGLYSIYDKDKAGLKYFTKEFESRFGNAQHISDVIEGPMQKGIPGAWIKSPYYTQVNNAEQLPDGTPDIFALMHTGGLYILPMAYDKIDYTPTLIGEGDPTIVTSPATSTDGTEKKEYRVYKNAYDSNTNTITFNASTKLNMENTTWSAGVLNKDNWKLVAGNRLPTREEVSTIETISTDENSNDNFIPANTVTRITVTYTDGKFSPIEFDQPDGTKSPAGSSIITKVTKSGEEGTGKSGEETKQLFLTNIDMYGYNLSAEGKRESHSQSMSVYNAISKSMNNDTSLGKSEGNDVTYTSSIIKDKLDDNGNRTGYIQMKLPENKPTDATYARVRYEVNNGMLKTASHIIDTDKDTGKMSTENNNLTQPGQYKESDKVIDNPAKYSDKDKNGNNIISETVEKIEGGQKDNVVDIYIPIVKTSQLDFSSKINGTGTVYLSGGNYTINEGEETEYDATSVCLLTPASFKCLDNTDIPQDGYMDIPFSFSSGLRCKTNPSISFNGTPIDSVDMSRQGGILASIESAGTDSDNKSDFTNKYFNCLYTQNDSSKSYYYSLRFFGGSPKNERVNLSKGTGMSTDYNMMTLGEIESEMKNYYGSKGLNDGTVKSSFYNYVVSAVQSLYNNKNINNCYLYVIDNTSQDCKSFMAITYKGNNQYDAVLINLFNDISVDQEKFIVSSTGINTMKLNAMDVSYNKANVSNLKSDQGLITGQHTNYSEPYLYYNKESIFEIGGRSYTLSKLSGNMISNIKYQAIYSTDTDKITDYNIYKKSPEGDGQPDVNLIGTSETGRSPIEQWSIFKSDNDSSLYYKDTSSTSETKKRIYDAFNDLDYEGNKSILETPIKVNGSSVMDDCTPFLPNACMNNISYEYKQVESSNDWDTDIRINIPTVSLSEEDEEKLLSNAITGTQVGQDGIQVIKDNTGGKCTYAYAYPLKQDAIVGKGVLDVTYNVNNDFKISHSLVTLAFDDISGTKILDIQYGFGSSDNSSGDKYTEGTSTKITRGKGFDYFNEQDQIVQDTRTDVPCSEITSGKFFVDSLNEVYHSNSDIHIQYISDSPYLVIPQGKSLSLTSVYSVNYKFDENKVDDLFTELTYDDIINGLEHKLDIYKMASQPSGESDLYNNFAYDTITLEGPFYESNLEGDDESLSCDLKDTNASITKSIYPRASFQTRSKIPIDYVWGKPTSYRYTAEGGGEIYHTRKRCRDKRDDDLYEQRMNEYVVYTYMEIDSKGIPKIVCTEPVHVWKLRSIGKHHTCSGHKTKPHSPECTKKVYLKLQPSKRTYTMMYDDGYINDAKNSRAYSIEGKGSPSKDYIVTAGKGVQATVRSKLITDFGSTANPVEIGEAYFKDPNKTYAKIKSDYNGNSSDKTKPHLLDMQSTGYTMELHPSFEIRYSLGSGEGQWDTAPFVSVYCKNNGSDTLTTTVKSDNLSLRGGAKDAFTYTDNQKDAFKPKIKVTTSTNETSGFQEYFMEHQTPIVYTNINYPESNSSSGTGLTIQLITTLNDKDAIKIGDTRQSITNLKIPCGMASNLEVDENGKTFSDKFILGQCWRYRLFVLSNMLNDVWAKPVD